MKRPASFRPRFCLVLFLAFAPALSGLLLSCSILGGLQSAAGFAGNLLSVASGNYSPDYADRIDNFLVALTKTGEKPAAASAAAEDPKKGPPLAMDVSVQKQVEENGDRVLKPLEDGDVLKHDPGDPLGGDKFRIDFRVNRECYVYIINIDATGKVTPLFPRSDVRWVNPLSGDRDYSLPEGDFAYSLDENTGIEHIYFVASLTPRPAVEDSLKEFHEMEGLVPQGLLDSGGGLLKVAQSALINRGIDEIVDGASILVKTATGEQAFSPTSFLTKFGGLDLVVTRWFNHE